MRLLVLRPREAGERTARRLVELGHEALLSPVMQVRPTGAAMPAGPFDVISATSAAAFSHPVDMPDSLLALPFLAVGERTALAAKQCGFTQVHAAEGERHSLAALARSLLRKGALPSAEPEPRLLLLLGRDHKDDTPALLEAAGVRPVPWIVYAAEAEAALSQEAVAALLAGQVDAVLHYSRRSATLALQLVADTPSFPLFRQLPQFCLSEDVAQPLRGAGIVKVEIAAWPHEDALLALLPRGGAQKRSQQKRSHGETDSRQVTRD